MKEKNDILVKILNLSKIMTILLGLILLILIIGVSKMYSTGEDEFNSQEQEYNTNYDVSMFEEIKASDIKKQTKNNTKVIYVGRESCGWCAAFLPNLWNAQEEYDFKTLYIDISKIIDFSTNEIIDETAFNTMTSLSGKGYEEYMKEYFGSTPMVLIMKDNKIINAHTGYTEYDSFKTIFDDIDL